MNGKLYEEEEEEQKQYAKPLLKFEQAFIKKLSIPQEPRLFCLIYQGNVVKYDNEENEDDSLQSECQPIILKEIHSFNQKSLDQKGAFLLDFCSEVFIWLGKKVANKDRL